MSIQHKFDQLMARFDLKPADFYFLDLIPLIEVIWADGKNQEGELKILYQFVIEHIAYLDQQSGIQAVSVDDANDFLDRFAHHKPAPELLDELAAIVSETRGSSSDDKNLTIYNYCLDIAAACASQYPFGLRDRIVDEEKRLLHRLFTDFNIARGITGP